MPGTQERASDWSDTDQQDNALATATKAAPGSAGLHHHITAIEGGYSGTISGKTLTLKSGGNVLKRWRVYDTLALVFPSPIRCNAGEAATLELEASGTGGTLGDVGFSGYTV